MRPLFFLTGPTAAAAGSICALLFKLHNFLTKIPLKFVQIIFPFSIDKYLFLWYNIIVVKGRGKPKSRQGREQKSKKNF